MCTHYIEIYSLYVYTTLYIVLCVCVYIYTPWMCIHTSISVYTPCTWAVLCPHLPAELCPVLASGSSPHLVNRWPCLTSDLTPLTPS
ncbi:hypothetical protein FKM82_029457 [Ascaphus truei]